MPNILAYLQRKGGSLNKNSSRLLGGSQTAQTEGWRKIFITLRTLESVIWTGNAGKRQNS